MIGELFFRPVVHHDEPRANEERQPFQVERTRR